MKLTLHYAQDAAAIKDGDTEQVYQDLLTELKTDNVEMKCSVELFILRVRGGIAQGELDHEDVVFVFEGRKLYPDESGRLSHWPEGFCGHTEKFLWMLI